MIFFFRKADISTGKVKVPNLGEKLFKSGRQHPYPPSPQRLLELEVVPQLGGSANDYGWLDLPDEVVDVRVDNAKEIILLCDVQGVAVAIWEWHRAVEQTGPMQLTVSNGPYRGFQLNSPLADRQVNVTADPLYDTAIEISIIHTTTTGDVNVWYRVDNGAMPAGYELVQTLLQATIPAGATDLNALGLI